MTRGLQWVACEKEWDRGQSSPLFVVSRGLQQHWKEAFLTEYRNWHNEGQINEQKLERTQSAITPKKKALSESSGRLRTWKSPRFEPEVYRKLTDENWIAEYRLMNLKQQKLVTNAARPSLEIASAGPHRTIPFWPIACVPDQFWHTGDLEEPTRKGCSN